MRRESVNCSEPAQQSNIVVHVSELALLHAAWIVFKAAKCPKAERIWFSFLLPMIGPLHLLLSSILCLPTTTELDNIF